jgi:squalene-hopene/tetraprenyl-beta-curcumene cyclase
MSNAERVGTTATARAASMVSPNVVQPTVLKIPESVASAARSAMAAARDHLMGLQHADGFWVGELEADTTLESDYILLEYYLRGSHLNSSRPETIRHEKVRAAANFIISKQLPDGGWNIYIGGPSNISATVKAYFALKLAGFDADAPFMLRAKEAVLRLGGVQAANTFTKIYLSIFGQYDWDACPAIPPELVLFPDLNYFSIYQMSSWSRAILVPLTVIYAHKPTRDIPGLSIDEIFKGGRRENLELPHDPRPISWRNFFLIIDKLAKLVERSRFKPLRAQALKRAEQWMRERFEECEGLGAIYPGMMNAIMALDCLGYRAGDPVMDKTLSEFHALEIAEGDTLRMQPCFSPVWDTAISLYAGLRTGLPADNPKAVQATDWLLDYQALGAGDWQVNRPKLEPGGWYFEYKNGYYPDIDDTAMVLQALALAKSTDPKRLKEAIRRGTNWMLGMQGADGGFAAFDVDNDHLVFCQAPFADHNAMLDPACPDITGRVLEALAALGYKKGSPQADRAIQWLQENQTSDGCWFGRWGVNYIYGTCFALRGLRASGEDWREAYILRAGEWLRSIQNHDGGWGESCESYDDPDQKGIGESTPSQTAWALMGLFATEDWDSDSVKRGVEYLLRTQTPDATWKEEACTGTGFPRVFYLRYHMYRHYFPMLALAEYANRTVAAKPAGYKNGTH